MYMNITDVKAIEILDSRGKPTIRAYIKLDDGSIHKASIPSGSSTGSHEALELRDNDAKRFLGNGVLKAVENVNTILKKTVIGMSTLEPDEVDKAMLAADGTDMKTNLGANAILAISMAVVKAAAYASEMPRWKFIHDYYFSQNTVSFPRLMVNVVNGGKHANWNFDFQEFMVSPLTNLPTESTQIGSEIFLNLGKLLKDRKLQTLVGDEGGYSPLLSSNEEVLEAIIEAGNNAGYENGKDFRICLDVASTEFYKDGKYTLQKTGEVKTFEELMEYYKKMQQTYNIESFEDPFAEDDWQAFKAFTAYANRSNIQVVGDDHYVTNVKRLEQGIAEKSANAILIKVNQIGTVYETALAMNMAKDAGFSNIVSHRSGETEDSFIADLAYGFGAKFIKTGSMSRSERLCKYNRLLEIEQMQDFGVL